MSTYREPNLPAIFSQGQQTLREFDRKLITVLAQWSDNLKTILDRGISFTDNVDCSIVSVTSHVTPGTEFSVAHLLGKVPAGYIVCGQGGAGSVYDGATANSKTTLYLKSDVGGVVFKVLVF